jgi:hypothetical protein
MSHGLGPFLRRFVEESSRIDYRNGIADGTEAGGGTGDGRPSPVSPEIAVTSDVHALVESESQVVRAGSFEIEAVLESVEVQAWQFRLDWGWYIVVLLDGITAARLEAGWL